MKEHLQRHFEVADPIIASIVSLTEQYELTATKYGSVFEVLARSIASQQLSGLVARRILDRLVAAHGGAFPTPAQIAAARPEDLRTVGFSYAKIAGLKDLAAHSLDGRLPPDAVLSSLDDEAVISHCVAVRGIGRWTAQMLLMFHLEREDVLPVDDYGVRNGFRLAYGLKGLPRPKSLAAFGQRWQPHRSAASWYLWRAIELHQQQKLPKRSGRAPRVEIEPAKATAKASTKAKARKKSRQKSPPRAKSRARRVKSR